MNNERQTGPVQAGELALVNKGCILSAENTPAVATEKLSSLENSAEGSINGIRIDSGDSVINNFGKILGSGIQWIRGTLFNEDTVTALAGNRQPYSTTEQSCRRTPEQPTSTTVRKA